MDGLNQSYSGDSCSVCGGSGWELSKKIIEGIYSEPKETEWARACHSCKTKARVVGDMPSEFYNADLFNFDWSVYGVDMTETQSICESVANNFRTWENHGEGIYIHSRTAGSGKTRLLCSIGNALAIKGHSVRFISSREYLETIKAGFKQDPGALNGEHNYLQFFDAEILILDDIGAEGKITDWAEGEFFRLINHRNNQNLITFYSSNLSPEKLRIGQRAISRIYDKAVVVQLPEVSVRAKRADIKKRTFVRYALQQEGRG